MQLKHILILLGVLVLVTSVWFAQRVPNEALEMPDDSRGSSEQMGSAQTDTLAPPRIGSRRESEIAPRHDETISGIVVQPSGEPVSGAFVSIYSFEGDVRSSERSGISGGFSVPVPSGGEYKVVVEKSGFFETQYTCSSKEQARLVLIARSRGSELCGRAIDIDGNAIESFQLSVALQVSATLSQEAIHSQRIVTDSGSFCVNIPQHSLALRNIKIVLNLRSPGYRPVRHIVSDLGSRLELVFEEAIAPVYGRVVNSSGAAIEGAVIIVYTDNGKEGSTRTDSDGSFTFDSLRGDRVMAVMAAALEYSLAWIVGEPDRDGMLIVLEGGARILGMVQDVDGLRIPDEGVFVWSEMLYPGISGPEAAAADWIRRVTTDEQGVFEVTGAPKGPVLVGLGEGARFGKKVVGIRTLDLTSGGTASVTLVQGKYSVSGVVSTARRALMRIDVRTSEGRLKARLDALGGGEFALPGLNPGQYFLVVSVLTEEPIKEYEFPFGIAQADVQLGTLVLNP
jgi:hypothetical protein